MPRPEDKPFAIPKLMVWEAWRQVKANKGAPGVDGQDLDAFEAGLEGNLYKIWNRMSSGTWFPPPVRAVEIPKPHGGGVRMLGVPTIADRVAQTVVAMQLEPVVEPPLAARHRFGDDAPLGRTRMASSWRKAVTARPASAVGQVVRLQQSGRCRRSCCCRACCRRNLGRRRSADQAAGDGESGASPRRTGRRDRGGRLVRPVPKRQPRPAPPTGSGAPHVEPLRGSGRNAGEMRSLPSPPVASDGFPCCSPSGCYG